MREITVRVVLDPGAEHAVVYDGDRLVVRPDADPVDVGSVVLSLLRGGGEGA